MITATRQRAETRFDAIEKRQRKLLDEQAEAARAVSDKTARLKALRLAKQASDLAEGTAKLLRTRKQSAVRTVS